MCLRCSCPPTVVGDLTSGLTNRLPLAAGVKILLRGQGQSGALVPPYWGVGAIRGAGSGRWGTPQKYSIRSDC